MIGRVVTILVTGCALHTFAALGVISNPGVAEDPPVRLQRKGTPGAEPAREKIPVPPNEEPPTKGARLTASIEETLARLTRNLEKSDERLRQKDVSEGTRQVQAEVVHGFDELIEHMRQQRQQNQQNAASSASSKRRRQESKPQTAKSDAGKRPQPSKVPSKQQTDSGQGGGRSLEERRKLADLYRDVWGHLPETVRQQMDAYARERFMPKYSELLKQYYSTLAEKGRRKGND